MLTIIMLVQLALLVTLWRLAFRQKEIYSLAKKAPNIALECYAPSSQNLQSSVTQSKATLGNIITSHPA